MTASAAVPAASPRRFSKLVGAGNDFLFIDARAGGFPQELRPALARRLCDRHFGPGADGAVFVEGKNGIDLRWDFYNADGSAAEMCGNAARCFVRWAQRFLRDDKIAFRAAAGEVRGRIVGPDAEVELPFVSRQSRLIARGSPAVARFWAFDTGVPHAVVEIADLAKAKDETAAIRELRWASEFGPRGANVTFFARQPEENRIASVTFERGVEGFTLACGTGVVAAALAYLESGVARADSNLEASLQASVQAGAQTEVQITVAAPGGVLTVIVDTASTGVRLRGPADFICEGEFAEEFMR